MQSAFLISFIEYNFTPYSIYASSLSAQGSTIIGSIPYVRSCLIISYTLLFLISEQFSLNVNPKITTLAVLGANPASTIFFTALSAMYIPILSFTILPFKTI